MSAIPLDDDFWRRHDHLLGIAPAAGPEITNRIPVVDPAAPPPPSPVAPAAAATAPGREVVDLVALDREVAETTARAVEAERRVAERDAALRAVVEAFEQQLADMEAEHARKLEAIRLGAEAVADRVLGDARRLVAELLGEPDATSGEGSRDDV